MHFDAGGAASDRGRALQVFCCGFLRHRDAVLPLRERQKFGSSSRAHGVQGAADRAASHKAHNGFMKYGLQDRGGAPVSESSRGRQNECERDGTVTDHLD